MALERPLVALLQEHGTDQAVDRRLVGGKVPMMLVRRLISPLRRSNGLVLWSFPQRPLGKDM